MSQGPAAPPGPDRLAKDPREGGDVAGQAVDADQDGSGHGAGQNPLHQPGDQGEHVAPPLDPGEAADAARALGCASIYAACVGQEGLVAAIVPGETPCLRCYLEVLPPAGSGPTCGR